MTKLKQTREPIGLMDISAARPRRRIDPVTVHSPYGHGIDRVNRIYDQLALMFKRKQITPRQFDAGERLQIAADTVYGQAGGAMDFDRARGGSLPGQPPALPYLVASETLHQAKMRLYPRDYATVYRVCVEGAKIETCCGLFGERRNGREAGKALRRGLDVLADLWWPEGERRSKASVFRSEKATVGDDAVVTVGRVYHAG